MMAAQPTSRDGVVTSSLTPSSGHGAHRHVAVAALTMSAASLSVAVLNALWGLMVARSLPTHEYGRFAYFSSVVLFGMMFVGLGITAVVITELAKSNSANDIEGLNTAFYSLLLLRCVTIAPLLLVGGGLALFTGDSLYLHAALTACCALLLDFLVGALQGVQRTPRVALGMAAQPALYLGFVAVGLVTSASAAARVMEVTYALAVVVAMLLLVKTELGRFHGRFVSRSYLDRAVPLTGKVSLVIVLQLAYSGLVLICLGALGYYREAALLSVPLTLVRILPSVTKPVFYAVFHPRLVEMLSRAENEAAKRLIAAFVEGSVVLTLTVAALMMVFPTTIIHTTYSEKYVGSSHALIVLAPMVCILAIDGLLTLFFIASHRPRIAVVALTTRLLLLAGLSAGILTWGSHAKIVLLAAAYVLSALVGVIIEYVEYQRWSGVAVIRLRVFLFAAYCFAVVVACRYALPDASFSPWPDMLRSAIPFQLLAAAAILGISVLLWFYLSLGRSMPRIGGGLFRIGLGGFVVCITLLGLLSPVRAQQQGSCAGTTEVPNRIVIDCAPGFATSRDRITVYLANGLRPDVPWQKQLSYADATWAFDAGATGKAKLVIQFHRDGAAVVADLYDDGDGDGEVRFGLRKDYPVVSENGGHWTIRVTAKDGWWTRDDIVNFNLDILVDGLVRGTFSSSLYARQLETMLKTDGDVDFEIRVRDTDRDGRPDYEWRQDRTPLPENPLVSGHNRSELVVNTEDDEVPIAQQDQVFWPFLGRSLIESKKADFESTLMAFAPYFVKGYNTGHPPIQLDWSRGRIVQVGEFVSSRGNPGNYFVYSRNRIVDDQLTETNFENPFGFYDLANVKDGWPDMLIRFEHELPQTLTISPGIRNNGYINNIEYAWDQDHNHSWDYQVSMVGNQSINDQIKFDEFTVRVIPHDDLPGWINDAKWQAATFVQVEHVPYWTAETIRLWTVENGGKVLSNRYIQGLDSTEPASAFSQIERGFRGEYTFDLEDKVELYFSPIDAKLHLVGAQRGIWNVDDSRQVVYLNVHGGDAIDGWQLLENGLLTEQLYRVPGGLIFSDQGETLYRAVDVPDEVFRTQPPTNHDEWIKLGQQLEENRRDFAPGDLRAMFDQFGGGEVAITTGPMTGFRRTADGMRFEVQVGDGETQDTLGKLTGARPGLGENVVTMTDGHWEADPAIYAEPRVTITTGMVEALSTAAVHLVIANAGNVDLSDATIVVKAVAPDGASGVTLANQDISVDGEGKRTLDLVWGAVSPGPWRIEATIMRPSKDARTGANVVLTQQSATVEVKPATMVSSAAATRLGWPGWTLDRLAVMLGFVGLVAAVAVVALCHGEQRT
jgi:O-antigen/teichoic acid export membrane protein